MTKNSNGSNGRSMRELLSRTSRTFALAIPLLPEPSRATVSLAYLLLRIADTMEDASNWDRDERVRRLSELADLLAAPSAERATVSSSAWLRHAPVSDRATLDLFAEARTLIGYLEQLSPDVRDIVVAHVTRTTLGMRDTLMSSAEPNGTLRLRALSELRAYCYVVAGIVGEMLTALFLHYSGELSKVKVELVEHQAAFGEGLQLVNILKDEKADAEAGRIYLPREIPRSEVIALARKDLRRAQVYVEALRRGRAPAGFVAFTGFPARLAEAALLRIEQDGPGAKVPREEVTAILREVQLSASAHSASAQSGK
jgi:farnesyl-diphosphate farnesyltransferase